MKVQIIDYGEGRTFLSQPTLLLAKISVPARPITALHSITHPTIVPEPIHPPERILGAPLSEKIDIWAVGYMAITMFTGADVFGHHGKDDRSRLYGMVEYLGLFEDSFIARCSRRNELLEEDGVPYDMYDDRVGDGYDWVTRETMPLNIHGFLPEPRTIEMDELVDFVSSCLQLDPEDRPSASELLAHRWLNNRVFSPV
ncbi:hypothetical protein H0H93_015493 [Arthromyces matolae]|nr:hypothetical protein H0H93_015493 [Arthromyces matolae]